MKVVGKVSNWYDVKNFGFIHENRNGVLYSYFFHRKHLMEGVPSPGKTARFDVIEEAKGPVATNVEIFYSETTMKETDATAEATAALAGTSTTTPDSTTVSTETR